MSTRATYEFKDEYDSFTIYRHHDGYPEGAYQWIANARKFAWPLPRFEASDFAAAFCAGNATPGGGGVGITTGRDAHGDTVSHYVIRCVNGKITVDRQERNLGTWKLAESGILDELLDKYTRPNGNG